LAGLESGAECRRRVFVGDLRGAWLRRSQQRERSQGHYEEPSCHGFLDHRVTAWDSVPMATREARCLKREDLSNRQRATRQRSEVGGERGIRTPGPLSEP